MRVAWKVELERRVEKMVKRARWSSNVQWGEEARVIRVLSEEEGQADLPASVGC